MNPGPGTYNNSSSLKGPKYPFGTGQRSQFDALKNPGPGYYKIPCKFANPPKYLVPNYDSQYKFI